MPDAVTGTNVSLKDLLYPSTRRKSAKKSKNSTDGSRARLAQAKLMALRLAAHAAAARGDVAAARRIAAEAHSIGRDLGRLARMAETGDTLQAAAERQAIRAGVDEARSIIAAARKAASHGSRDDRDMEEMERRMESPVDESV